MRRGSRARFLRVADWQKSSERGRRISRLEGEAVTDLCLSSESGKSYAAGVKAPRIEMSMGSLSARVALCSGILATEYGAEAELDRLLKEVNCFITENEQFEKLILEKNAPMKVTSTCLVDMEKNKVTMETEKGLLITSSTGKLFSST